jgi:hypothetical protein
VPDTGEGSGKDHEPPPAALVLWTESALAARAPSPALVAWSGERAAFRTIEFLMGVEPRAGYDWRRSCDSAAFQSP